MRRLIECLLPLLFLLNVGWIEAAPLRIGVIDVAPYGMRSANGQLDGVFYRLSGEIALQAKLPATRALYPTARLYALMQKRQLDLAITSRDLGRDFGLLNLGKVSSFDGVVVFRNDLHPPPSSLTQLQGRLIGRLNGTCPPLAKAGHRLYDLASYGQGLRMLAQGRLEGMCGEYNGLRYAMKGEPKSTQMLAPPLVFLQTDVWVFANPALPSEMLTSLRQAVLQLNREGLPKALLDEFLLK